MAPKNSPQFKKSTSIQTWITTITSPIPAHIFQSLTNSNSMQDQNNLDTSSIRIPLNTTHSFLSLSLSLYNTYWEIPWKTEVLLTWTVKDAYELIIFKRGREKKEKSDIQSHLLPGSYPYLLQRIHLFQMVLFPKGIQIIPSHMIRTRIIIIFNFSMAYSQDQKASDFGSVGV